MNLSALEKAINEQHAQSPFSGVLSVREQGESILAQSHGYANRPERIPNTMDTRFAMASGSKTFTSVAVCQLVERGVVSFDTRLKDCLDIPLPQFDPGVTLHHLLSHSSGIPDYFDESVMDDYEVVWRERPMYGFRKASDFLPLFADQPMQFKPGEGWAYNNAGFIVLGLVIEQLSGMPFPEYVEKHIFQPCGMTASGYFAMDQLPGGTAQGYIPAGDGEWRSNIYAVPIMGQSDGGAYTTAADLARFWDALLGHRLLSEATVAKMLTPHWPTKATGDEYYGYGLWIRQENGLPRVYAMIGDDPGVAFFSGFYPAQQIQFTLMGNMADAAWAMLRCITGILKGA